MSPDDAVSPKRPFQGDKHLLIIGQGLAGTLLSARALEAGLSFDAIDAEAEMGGSSRAAGGVIDPIMGQRLALTWRAADFLRETADFFTRWETTLGVKLYHPQPVLRAFRTPAARAEFEKRRSHFAEAGIPVNENPQYPTGFAHPEGGFEHSCAGWVDVPLWIDSMRAHLARLGHFTVARWDVITENHDRESTPVSWRGQTYEYLAFAEGAHIRKNPALQSSEWGGTQGESLVVTLPTLSTARILKRKIAIVPLGATTAQFRLAATFSRTGLGEAPTTAARDELLADLAEMLGPGHLTPEIVRQNAGIRPHFRDHRPVIGPHPTRPREIIFNGLGSKGVLWGPLCSRWLIEHLVHQSPIPHEVSALRLAATKTAS